VVDLSNLNWWQKLWFGILYPFWAKSAWEIAQAAGNRADINEILSARTAIWKIAPSWATTPFLQRLFSIPAFSKLVGLRICQWCFNARYTERQGQLRMYLIKVIFSVDGAPGAESGAWIRLDNTHYGELNGKLKGIMVCSSGHANHITLKWVSAYQSIQNTPVNRRLITGGQLMDTLNPKGLEVRDCDGQVIWSPNEKVLG